MNAIQLSGLRLRVVLVLEAGGGRLARLFHAAVYPLNHPY